MRNRRLTIFPLAMILMTACGDSTAINPEMLSLRGTWSVQTWTVTQVASPNTVVNMLAGTAGDPVEQDGVVDAWRFLYDDGTMLSVFNYPDTLATNQPLAGYGSIVLDESTLGGFVVGGTDRKNAVRSRLARGPGFADHVNGITSTGSGEDGCPPAGRLDRGTNQEFVFVGR